MLAGIGIGEENGHGNNVVRIGEDEGGNKEADSSIFIAQVAAAAIGGPDQIPSIPARSKSAIALLRKRG